MYIVLRGAYFTDGRWDDFRVSTGAKLMGSKMLMGKNRGGVRGVEVGVYAGIDWCIWVEGITVGHIS